jgi:predicted MFS family arabinose efflux permease
MNCGIMAGGLIATRSEQRVVFFFGFFLWMFVMTAFLFLTRAKTQKKSETKVSVLNVSGLAPVRAPLAFPRGIAAYLLLAFFPFTLYSGFMFYLVPVFGSQAGFSDTEISLIFMFFGMGIMLFGSKIVASARGETVKISFFLWLALILEIAGILCFASFQSAAAMLAAVFILGGAYGIGNVYFPLYLTEMPEAKSLREGAGMGLFSFTESMGIIVGPIVFSVIFHLGNPLWYYLLALLMFLPSLLYHIIRRDVIEVRQ